MARSRNIKPGFFTNDALAELPALTRLLFIGLWTLVDREGRIEDRPKKIKAECMPYDDLDAEEAIASLERAGFLTRYEAGGMRCIQVQNWNKHQNPHVKEQPSTIPAPDKPGACTEVAGLIPDSGFRIPDSKDIGAHTAAEAVDNSERALSGFQPTKAGAICRAMRAAGMAQTNPGDPRLLALIEQGATEAEFVGIAGEAAAGGKGWAWVLKVLQARRADAAAIALAPAEPVKHWTETSTGIIAKGKELGLGEPNPLEQFPVYRARVLKAANVVTQ